MYTFHMHTQLMICNIIEESEVVISVICLFILAQRVKMLKKNKQKKKRNSCMC